MKLAAVLQLIGLAAGGFIASPTSTASSCNRRRAGAVPTAQFGFKVQKSDRLLIREAWEKADAYRPGKANWFTQQ